MINVSHIRRSYLGLLLFVSALLTACDFNLGSESGSKEQNLALANTYLQQELDNRATEFFRKVLKEDPNSIESLYGLATIAQRRGDTNSALTYYQKIITIDPQQKAAHLYSGHVYLLQNKLEQAQETAATLEEIAADDFEANLFRARALALSGEMEKALLIADEVVEQYPKNSSAAIFLSNIYMNMEQADMAIEAIDNAITSQPDTEQEQLLLYQQKLRILAASGETQEIDDLGRLMLEYYPDNPAVYLRFANYYLSQDRREDSQALVERLVQRGNLQLESLLAVVEFYRGIDERKTALELLQQHQSQYADDWSFSLALAEEYAADGDETAARKTYQILYTRLSQQQPVGVSLVRAGTSYATFERQNGNRDKARELMSDLLAQTPTDIRVLLLNASLDIDDKDYRSAIAHLKKVTNVDPANISAMVMLANAYTGLEQHRLATETYKKGLELVPDNKILVLGYLETLAAAGNYSEAYNLANQWLEKFPQDVELLRRQIDNSIREGFYSELSGLVTRLEEAQGQTAYSRYIQGVVEANSRNLQQAVAAFKQSLALDNNNQRVASALLQTYRLLDQEQNAIAYFKTLATTGSSVANLILGQTYQNQKAYNQAVSHYRQAISIDPKLTNGYSALADTYYIQGDVKAAEASLREGLEENKESSSLLYQLGSILLSDNRPSEALANYKKVMELNPSNVLAVNNYISLLSEQATDKQQLREAEPWIQSLDKTKDHRAYDTIAWFYHKLGDQYKANLNIERAIRANDQEPLYHYHAGMIYRAQNRQDMARSSLEKALSLANENDAEWIQKAQELLENNSQTNNLSD